MKRSALVIPLFFVSFMAYGECPMINDVYHCNNGTHEFFREVRTNIDEETQAYYYRVRDDNKSRLHFKTDDEPRPVQFKSTFYWLRGLLKSTCDEKAIYGQFKGNVRDEFDDIRIEMKMVPEEDTLTLGYKYYVNDKMTEETIDHCTSIF